eukprot:4997015-Prymnesium_polylepis.1
MEAPRGRQGHETQQTYECPQGEWKPGRAVAATCRGNVHAELPLPQYGRQQAAGQTQGAPHKTSAVTCHAVSRP